MRGLCRAPQSLRQRNRAKGFGESMSRSIASRWSALRWGLPLPSSSPDWGKSFRGQGSTNHQDDCWPRCLRSPASEFGPGGIAQMLVHGLTRSAFVRIVLRLHVTQLTSSSVDDSVVIKGVLFCNAIGNTQ